MAGSGGRSTHRGHALAIAVGLLLISPAPGALAADTYVDRSDGDNADDTNNCRDPEAPCATLGRGISQAGDDDTVYVGGDLEPFTVSQTLGDGKSIVAKDFSTTPAVDTSGFAIVDTGDDPDPAITVDSKAGKIKGLIVRSHATPLMINAGVTVKDVRFDESDVSQAEVQVDTAADVTIEESIFFDQGPISDTVQYGVLVTGSGKLKIKKSIFDQFSTAILAFGNGAVTVTGTEIAGTHAAAIAGTAIQGGDSSDLTVKTTHVHSPEGTGQTYGLQLSGRADVSRTLIEDHTTGILVHNNPHKTFLDSVAITTPDGSIGLQAEDAGLDDPDTSEVKATNITISGDADYGLSLIQSHLRLDSSIIDAGGILLGGAPTCDITRSRGPVEGSGDCEYQTDADPELANDGYHLTSDSAMIDKGDPDKPEQGAKDIDGDKRALDGTGNCEGEKRRDRGADEYVC